MRIASTALTAFLLTGSAFAETKAGPRGGKLLENKPPRAELLLTEDRTASIAFYDDEGKQVPPASQVVSGTAETAGSKTKLEFEKESDLLVLKGSLPEGENYNIVLQIRMEPSAKPENFRVKYNMHICGECNRAEYACTCDH